MKLLDASDIERLRSAIRKWGKPAIVASKYDEKMLLSQIEIWRTVTEMKWNAVDEPKYEQDITIRYWLQVAMEAVGFRTAERLEKLIQPIDTIFQSRMIPQNAKTYGKRPQLKEKEYFWEAHTLLPK